MKVGRKPTTTHPVDELLDIAQGKLGVETRREVFELTGINAPLMSKIRHQILPVTAETILKFHDATEMSIAEIRERLGIKPYFVFPNKDAQQAGGEQLAQN